MTLFLTQFLQISWSESGFWFGMLAALILGISKSGIKGITVIIVTILALVHGGKASTGVLLPLLIFADIIAVSYYKRHIEWKHFWSMIPWMVIGVVIGAFIGKDMPEVIFKQLMAIIIMITVLLMIYWEYSKNIKVPSHRGFAVTMGLLAGITTMIGNLAGAFSNLYFLANRVPKNAFIGTAAFLFFCINIFKLPFHIWLWKTVNWNSIQTSIQMMPAVFLGFFMGVYIVRMIPEIWYRNMILILTAVGALIIFFR